MYRLESHGRWYFDTDTKPDKVLEQSPNTDALCPNHIHHWLSYCSSYRSTKSSCGPVKWIPTSQPRCKPGSEPGKCCDQVQVIADNNAIQNLNVSGKFCCILPVLLHLVVLAGLQKFIRAAEGTYFNTIDQIGERSDSNIMGNTMGYGNWYWHHLCNLTLIYSVSNYASKL